MRNNEITIVLPCAGEGTRMNLNYPKELFEIFSGKKLIDFSIGHIKYFLFRSDISVKIVVVISKEKEQVFEYVNDRLSEANVIPVFFNEEFREWPGSVYSANSHFSEANVVLLPDSFISLSKTDRFSDEKGKGIIEKALKILEDRTVVFGVKKCLDPDILKNLGAVSTMEDRIELLIDKPLKNDKRLNGFWGVYGFRKEVSPELYKFLIRTVEKKKIDIRMQKFFPPGFFFIENYFDLGTKEAVEIFRRSNLNMFS